MVKGQKGQMMMLNMMYLVMTILILSAFLPVIKTTLDSTRGQDSLNCKSTDYVCPTMSPGGWCYNSTRQTETVGCLALDLYVPYIVMAILIGGVAYLLSGKGQGQPGYGGYQ